jgi:hypothetical protein
MAQVRNDGVLEKRFEQRFPLDLALYKNPLLLTLRTMFKNPYQVIDFFSIVRSCKWG